MRHEKLGIVKFTYGAYGARTYASVTFTKLRNRMNQSLAVVVLGFVLE